MKRQRVDEGGKHADARDDADRKAQPSQLERLGPGDFFEDDHEESERIRQKVELLKSKQE